MNLRSLIIFVTTFLFFEKIFDGGLEITARNFVVKHLEFVCHNSYNRLWSYLQNYIELASRAEQHQCGYKWISKIRKYLHNACTVYITFFLKCKSEMNWSNRSAFEFVKIRKIKLFFCRPQITLAPVCKRKSPTEIQWVFQLLPLHTG